MDISLSNVLHTISQFILTPVMVILLLLVIVSIWQVGDVLVEYWLERRRRCRNVPALLERLHAAGPADLPEAVEASELAQRQKKALLRLLAAQGLSRREHEVMAQQLLADEEARCGKALGVTDLVARLGPMFGLLGTLIPLGPGIVALGQGDTAALADSLAIAFDTTVMGVISAAICSVISKLRRGWYDDYLLTLESCMEYVLEAVDGHVEK